MNKVYKVKFNAFVSTFEMYCCRYEKKKRQNNWFVKAAQEMDMELDDSHLYPLFFTRLFYKLISSIVREI